MPPSAHCVLGFHNCMWSLDQQRGNIDVVYCALGTSLFYVDSWPAEFTKYNTWMIV